MQEHQEAIELGLRQGKGPDLVMRMLGRDDKEGAGQLACRAFDRRLALLHRLEEGALCLGSGPVDLIGQHHLGEDGAGVEAEGLDAALADRDPDDVRRQQVVGELDARVLEAQEPG